MFLNGRHFGGSCRYKIQNAKTRSKKELKFGGPANNSFYGNLEKSDGRFWDPNVCLKVILLGRWRGVSLLLPIHENRENPGQASKQTHASLVSEARL